MMPPKTSKNKSCPVENAPDAVVPPGPRHRAGRPLHIRVGEEGRRRGSALKCRYCLACPSQSNWLNGWTETQAAQEDSDHPPAKDEDPATYYCSVNCKLMQLQLGIDKGSFG